MALLSLESGMWSHAQCRLDACVNSHGRFNIMLWWGWLQSMSGSVETSLYFEARSVKWLTIYLWRVSWLLCLLTCNVSLSIHYLELWDLNVYESVCASVISFESDFTRSSCWGMLQNIMRLPSAFWRDHCACQRCEPGCIFLTQMFLCFCRCDVGTVVILGSQLESLLWLRNLDFSIVT